jgi:hypothetical protein
MSFEHRRNPDSEECQKMHRENEAYIRTLKLPRDYYEIERLKASKTCKHSYREDSTVCEICGS